MPKVRNYESSRIRPCGSCGKDVDLVQIERDAGGTHVESFMCRRCGSIYPTHDMTKKKVKDAAGRVIQIVADPEGRAAFWRLYNAMNDPHRCVNRRRALQDRKAWEEFISTRPFVSWADPHAKKDKTDPDAFDEKGRPFAAIDPDEWSGRTNHKALAAKELHAVHGVKDPTKILRYASVDPLPFAPPASGDMGRLIQADPEQSVHAPRPMPHRKAPKVLGHYTDSMGRTITRLESPSKPPASIMSQPKVHNRPPKDLQTNQEISAEEFTASGMSVYRHR